MPQNSADVNDLAYEEARDELIAIVAKLEAGAANLDDSVGLWERGEALAARCQELLDGANARIAHAQGNTDDADDSAADEGDLDIADAGVIGIVPADEPADEEDNA
ncbi:exodeoxyribonuclease VII small subunit [Demequina sediminicola]|uniref:exodeoxyribonuclease VII small subunit n=1 Tax=Demequina sediminicola TaxID=1095026 RepID=UPI000782186D|nr:exodeoxyribonuclease VII small subunit [Demequina sediminicola]